MDLINSTENVQVIAPNNRWIRINKTWYVFVKDTDYSKPLYDYWEVTGPRPKDLSFGRTKHLTPELLADFMVCKLLDRVFDQGTPYKQWL